MSGRTQKHKGVGVAAGIAATHAAQEAKAQIAMEKEALETIKAALRTMPPGIATDAAVVTAMTAAEERLKTAEAAVAAIETERNLSITMRHFFH